MKNTILVLADLNDTAHLQSALAWLENQTGQESTFFSRVRRLLLFKQRIIHAAKKCRTQKPLLALRRIRG